jgi:hypothetical protein
MQGQEASAVAVVQVDGEISDAVLNDLRCIETVLLAKAIRFVALGQQKKVEVAQ